MIEHWKNKQSRLSMEPAPRPNAEQIKNRSEVSKWVRELHDNELSDLVEMIYHEGANRGFGTYWLG